MTNWGNNNVRQNSQKTSRAKMHTYVQEIEKEYKRLKEQYEPNTDLMELKGQKLVVNLVDSYKRGVY